MYPTPRRSPRFAFIAVAEIAYRQSEGVGRLTGRVVTINLHGCYIESPYTLPTGREVSIKIFAESEWFGATAKVVYELPKSAMGLAFDEVPVKSRAILRQWLRKGGEVPEGF
jgi:hypothetical protein